MDKRESFLDVLKETMEELEIYDRITPKQLKEGIHIPLEWMQSKGIKKEHIINAMNVLCLNFDLDEKSKDKNKKSIKDICIIRKNNTIYIDVYDEADAVIYRIAKFKPKSQELNVVESQDFIKAIYEEKIKSSMEIVQKKFKLTEEEAKEVIDEVFNETQKTNDLNGLSASLCEMMQNIGKKYKENNKKENNKTENIKKENKEIDEVSNEQIDKKENVDNKDKESQEDSQEFVNVLPAVSRKGLIRRIIENFFFYDDET